MLSFLLLVAAGVGVSRYMKKNPERVSGFVRFIRERLAKG